LRTRIRDHAGDQVALARRTTTRIAREIGQDTTYTEGDAAVEIDRLKAQNEELKAQIVVLQGIQMKQLGAHEDIEDLDEEAEGEAAQNILG
jgi:hypothetical protein